MNNNNDNTANSDTDKNNCMARVSPTSRTQYVEDNTNSTAGQKKHIVPEDEEMTRNTRQDMMVDDSNATINNGKSSQGLVPQQVYGYDYEGAAQEHQQVTPHHQQPQQPQHASQQGRFHQQQNQHHRHESFEYRHLMADVRGGDTPMPKVEDEEVADLYRQQHRHRSNSQLQHVETDSSADAKEEEGDTGGGGNNGGTVSGDGSTSTGNGAVNTMNTNMGMNMMTMTIIANQESDEDALLLEQHEHPHHEEPAAATSITADAAIMDSTSKTGSHHNKRSLLEVHGRDYPHDHDAETASGTKRARTNPKELGTTSGDGDSPNRSHNAASIGSSIPACTATSETTTRTPTLIPKKANHEQWDSMFERLKEYKERNGDCLVPKRHLRDPKLGTWVETQRVQYKRLPRVLSEDGQTEIVKPNKRLTHERLDKLASIGFAWSAKLKPQQAQQQRRCSSGSNASMPAIPTGTAGATTTSSSPSTFPTQSNNNNSTSGQRNPKSQMLSPNDDTNQRHDEGALAGTTLTEPFVGSSFDSKAANVAPSETNNASSISDSGSAGNFGNQHHPHHHLTPNAVATTTTAPLTATVSHPHPSGNLNTSISTTPSSASQNTTNSNTNVLLRRQRLNEVQWEDMYQRLVQYKHHYGNCLVPRKYEKDPKLATWVETQRVLWNRDYRKQPPPPTSCDNITSTHTNTSSSLADPSSQTRSTSNSSSMEAANLVADLIYGNDTTGSGPTSGINNMKRLAPERKAKLDELGFVWSLRSKRIEDHWDQMFQKLVEYKQMHGDCLVPSRYEANLKLGKWVETQRYEYTKLQRALQDAETRSETSDKGVLAAVEKAAPTNPRLTEDRLRRLEAIGFEWKVKNKMKRYYDKQWDQMFQRLMSFREETGHCMVPKRYPPDMKLGTWVHTQRIQYRKLTTGKMEGDTSTQESREEEAEKSLLAALPKGESEISYRLTDERRKRLEQVGFVWSAREGEKGTDTARITRNSYDDQWDSMFEQLKEYKQKRGDCLVPKRYKENPKLGTWVDTQRVQYKKLMKKLESKQSGAEDDYSSFPDQHDQDSLPEQESKGTGNSSATAKPLVGRLTDDRIQRLQNLGFVWSLRDNWQKHYEELKSYKEQHGHCNVPARYAANHRLGIWVSAQRQQYKTRHQHSADMSRPRRSAPLTEDRIKLLNELGFTWTIRSRDSLGESWNQRLDELKQFKATHNHCLVPSRYPPNPELGIWVGTQRTQYRLYMKAKETGTLLTGSTAMNEDRIHELEELGFVWALRGDSRKDPLEEAVAAAEAAAAVEAADELGAMEHYNVINL